jgi:hypothetical protein
VTGHAAPLESVQRWMQDALVFPRRVDRADADRLLAPSPGLSAAEGLAIYQRGFLLRIAGCMREQFPALCHALGQPLFDDFVADYVRDLPPESHTLYDLGRRFAGWLDESRPDRDMAPAERETWIDFMVDLAGFERLVFHMFDAPGHEGRRFADAATPDANLRLQPGFAVGSWRYPVAAYYHSVRRGEAPPLPPAGETFAALVRTDYVTRTISLTEPHYFFLKAMAEGGTVDNAIEAAARHLAVAPDEIRQTWCAPDGPRARWSEWGFFIEEEPAGNG